MLGEPIIMMVIDAKICTYSYIYLLVIIMSKNNILVLYSGLIDCN